VLADDWPADRPHGLARCRPLLRVIMDSQLRLPLDSKMVRSAAGDVVVVATSASSVERRKLLEERGIRVLIFDGPGGRAHLGSLIDWMGRQRYLSLMIEAGSKVNWTALESGVVDRIFFYYGPKILGGLEALPLGRRPRAPPARGCHSHTRRDHSPDSAGRVRRGRIRGCSPGLLKNWARWNPSARA